MAMEFEIDNQANAGLLDCQPELLNLLELLVNVMFCMKGVDGRYLAVNAAFVRRAGKKSKREVIGRQANELFREELAQRYEEQDTEVFATGQPLRDELEIIRREDGSLGWYLTTKLPVFDTDGAVNGLVSISADLNTDQNAPEMVELKGMIDVVHARLSDTIRNADLAEAAHCSESQLERRVRKVFGCSPTQYVLRGSGGGSGSSARRVRPFTGRYRRHLRLLRPSRFHSPIRPAHQRDTGTIPRPGRVVENRVNRSIPKQIRSSTHLQSRIAVDASYRGY